MDPFLSCEQHPLLLELLVNLIKLIDFLSVIGFLDIDTALKGFLVFFLSLFFILDFLTIVFFGLIGVKFRQNK